MNKSEQSISAPEAEQSLTPRQRLENYLKDEQPGSIKCQAIADQIAYTRAFNPRGSNDDENRTIILQEIIGETIRNRSFGPNGTEYNKASNDFNKLFKSYTEFKSYTDVNISSQIKNYINQDRSLIINNALNSMGIDLLEINRKKSISIQKNLEKLAT